MGKHPKGLFLLAATEVAERFSYYGMRSLLVLYLTSVFFTQEVTSQVYGAFTGTLYLAPILGGYIADRYWGNNRSIIVGGIVCAVGQLLMFVGASFAQQSIFQPYGAIDPSVDNTLSIVLTISALVLIIIGNGFFKPNISSMVGELYPVGDQRQESGFTLFYMGINIGALVAPLICGLFLGSWEDPTFFRWGFLCAFITMTLSVILFAVMKNRLLISPSGKHVGTPPVSQKKREREQRGERETDDVKQKAKGPAALRIAILVIAAIALFLFFARNTDNPTDIITSLICVAGIVVSAALASEPSLSKAERKHVFAILLFSILAVFFSAAFEQTGVSLIYLIDEHVNRAVGSFTVPTTWFMSVEPVCVVIMGPLLIALWDALAKRGKNPSIPMKFGIGLTILAGAYFMLAFACSSIGTDVSTAAKISMIWLVLLFLLQSIGELAISPIGLSLVNSLAPKRFASLMLGVWFLSTAIGNTVAGNIATLYPSINTDGVMESHYFLGIQISTVSDFFMLIAVVVVLAAVLAFVLVKPLNYLMSALEVDGDPDASSQSSDEPSPEESELLMQGDENPSQGLA